MATQRRVQSALPDRSERHRRVGTNGRVRRHDDRVALCTMRAIPPRSPSASACRRDDLAPVTKVALPSRMKCNSVASGCTAGGLHGSMHFMNRILIRHTIVASADRRACNGAFNRTPAPAEAHSTSRCRAEVCALAIHRRMSDRAVRSERATKWHSAWKHLVLFHMVQ